MIRFSLQCEKAHGFEGWFGSNADFDSQQARGLVECPACGSTHIEKALMMPSVVSSRKKAPVTIEAEPSSNAVTAKPDNTSQDVAAVSTLPEKAPTAADIATLMKMQALVRHIRANSENVGTKFATEARDIHDGLKPERPIMGTASGDEIEALLDDGIAVAPLPSLPEDQN